MMAVPAPTHGLTLAGRDAKSELRVTLPKATNWRNMFPGGQRDHHATPPITSVPPISMTSSKDSVKPIQTFRLRGITASVFANKAETKNGDITFHKVSIQRTYKDGDEFKTTASFGRDDLPIVRLLTDRAWHFILDTEANRGRDEDSAE